MAARMVTGARRCDRITPILEHLHWLPVSQRVVFKMAPDGLQYCCSLSRRPLHTYQGHVRLRELALCIQPNSTGSARLDISGAAKFCRQWTDHLEHYAACITNTRAVTECTEDAPVLDRSAPLRRFYAISTPNTNALTD